MRAQLCMLASVAVSLAVRSGLASEAEDERRAAALFRAASAAYEKGDFVAAGQTFEGAHRLVPRAQTIYNAGLAWFAAGARARAANAFEAALSVGGLTDSQADDARHRLSTVASELGRLHIVAPPTISISIDGEEIRPIPETILVEPGTHEIAFRSGDGAAATRSITLGASEEQTAAFEPKLDLAPRPPNAEITAVTPIDRTPASASTRIWSVVPLGVASIAGGASVVFGIEAIRARDTFDASAHMDRPAHDRAEAHRLESDIALGIALASGAIGIALLAGMFGD